MVAALKKERMPELLVEDATAAARKYLQKGVELNKAVKAQVDRARAEGYEMTAKQTELVCQLANRYVHRALKLKSPIVSFKIATCKGVQGQEAMGRAVKTVPKKRKYDMDAYLPTVSDGGKAQIPAALGKTAGLSALKVRGEIATPEKKIRSARDAEVSLTLHVDAVKATMDGLVKQGMDRDQILGACLKVDGATNKQGICSVLCISHFGEDSFTAPEKYTKLTLDKSNEFVRQLQKLVVLAKAYMGHQEMEKQSAQGAVVDPLVSGITRTARAVKNHLGMAFTVPFILADTVGAGKKGYKSAMAPSVVMR